jgi:hypothetical protein
VLAMVGTGAGLWAANRVHREHYEAG